MNMATTSWIGTKGKRTSGDPTRRKYRCHVVKGADQSVVAMSVKRGYSKVYPSEGTDGLGEIGRANAVPTKVHRKSHP